MKISTAFTLLLATSATLYGCSILNAPDDLAPAGSGGSAGTGGTDNLGGMGGESDMPCPDGCPDDGNPCTDDVCNEITGECGVPMSGQACGDDIYCNGEEICDAGECVKLGETCEERGLICNESLKGCACDDDNDCGGDQYGDWSECSLTPANPCTGQPRTRLFTRWTCDPVRHVCERDTTVEDGFCDPVVAEGGACPSDGQYCNGNEFCAGGSCVPSGDDPCSGQSNPYCNESSNQCKECTTDTHCSGAGEYCTSSLGGDCTINCKVPQPPIIRDSCPDGYVCTPTGSKEATCQPEGTSTTCIPACKIGQKCCKGNCIPTSNTCK